MTGVMVRNKLFASLSKGGQMQVRECVDYPGIIIHTIKETRNHDWVQTISYEGEECKTIAEAINAWKANQNQSNGGQS